MKYLITLYIPFIVACGPAPVVEPQYLEYLSKFNREAANRGLASDTSGISVITVESLPENVVGQCSPSDNTISILKSYWNYTNDATHEALMFHECGHCVLHYGHTLNYPAIMYPYVLNDTVYISNRSMLLDKFFSNNF